MPGALGGLRNSFIAKRFRHFVIFSKPIGSNSHHFFEGLYKIADIVKSGSKGNICDWQIGRFKHILCRTDPGMINLLGWCHTSEFFKVFKEIICAHIQNIGKV